jgi:hypothetical protein
MAATQVHLTGVAGARTERAERRVRTGITRFGDGPDAGFGDPPISQIDADPKTKGSVYLGTLRTVSLLRLLNLRDPGVLGGQ